jgi:tetratricopeptide (TPR) repeat protein
LFRLGELHEQAGEIDEALEVYGRVVARAGRYEADAWPDRTGARLRMLLEPSLSAAVRDQDDFTAVSIFHRHGPQADRLYARQAVLLAVADAHTRLGFTTAAAALYQSVVRNPPSLQAVESALMGLGACYLDQQDPHAAQLVFERYRLQFPLGRYAIEAFLLLLTAMSEQRDYHSVLRLGRQWLQKHPREESRKRIIAKMGMALMALHRPEEARHLLGEAHRLGGLTTAEELTTYGDLLTKVQLHEQAVALYRQSLAVKPDADVAAWDHVQIGRNFRAAQRLAQARAAWSEIGPNDHPLFQRIAAALQQDLPQAVSGERSRP